ncbi:hypothetical protein DIPPA_70083 [Diplonema papillatum]|nr:hypothetical protein DIPPA_70083 [Diplonema papillatum]
MAALRALTVRFHCRIGDAELASALKQVVSAPATVAPRTGRRTAEEKKQEEDEKMRQKERAEKMKRLAELDLTYEESLLVSSSFTYLSQNVIGTILRVKFGERVTAIDPKNEALRWAEAKMARMYTKYRSTEPGEEGEVRQREVNSDHSLAQVFEAGRLLHIDVNITFPPQKLDALRAYFCAHHPELHDELFAAQAKKSSLINTEKKAQVRAFLSTTADVAPETLYGVIFDGCNVRCPCRLSIKPHAGKLTRSQNFVSHFVKCPTLRQNVPQSVKSKFDEVLAGLKSKNKSAVAKRKAPVQDDRQSKLTALLDSKAFKIPRREAPATTPPAATASTPAPPEAPAEATSPDPAP